MDADAPDVSSTEQVLSASDNINFYNENWE